MTTLTWFFVFQFMTAITFVAHTAAAAAAAGGATAETVSEQECLANNNNNMTSLCDAPNAESKITRKMLFDGKIPTVSQEKEPDFLIPSHLKPGEMAPIVWREDGKVADPEGYVIGLPSKVREEFETYLDEAGILELSRKLIYEDPVKPGENRMYNMYDGSKWGVKGPAGKLWKNGDLTWIDAADEETYELTLGLLMRGGFDVVLEALKEKFKLDGLMIHGAGVIIVSKFISNNLHVDIGDTGSKFFNIVFPITLPKSADAKLKIGDKDDESRVGTVSFRNDAGIVLGSDTTHGTMTCDYREADEIRVSIAVYVADLTDANIEDIANDATSIFPADGDVKWFRAQKGRFANSGKSLVNDKGRKPYQAKDDKNLDCPALAKAGKCETDLMKTRMRCPKSCNVYMSDDEYYSTLFGM